MVVFDGLGPKVVVANRHKHKMTQTNQSNANQQKHQKWLSACGSLPTMKAIAGSLSHFRRILLRSDTICKRCPTQCPRNYCCQMRPRKSDALQVERKELIQCVHDRGGWVSSLLDHPQAVCPTCKSTPRKWLKSPKWSIMMGCRLTVNSGAQHNEWVARPAQHTTASFTHCKSGDRQNLLQQLVVHHWQKMPSCVLNRTPFVRNRLGDVMASGSRILATVCIVILNLGSLWPKFTKKWAEIEIGRSQFGSPMVSPRRLNTHSVVDEVSKIEETPWQLQKSHTSLGLSHHFLHRTVSDEDHFPLFLQGSLQNAMVVTHWNRTKFARTLEWKLFLRFPDDIALAKTKW